MSSQHFLFPDNSPPPFPQGADVREACIWCLAVMDEGDPAGRFISSILSFYLTQGYVTERQMEALRKTCSRVIAKYVDGTLACMGANPAPSQTLEFGEVIEFVRPALIEGDNP